MTINELKQLKEAFEASLKVYIKEFYPKERFSSYSYMLEGNAGRFRPLLTLSAYKDFGGTDLDAVMPVAIAIEMIHTYSLIHDDLPSMDDSHLRRGLATLHIRYDEATAVLTGDGLLTDAFLLLSSNKKLCAEETLLVVKEISAAAGSKGMVLGQLQDIYLHNQGDVTCEQLRNIHILKTAKMIEASVVVGALCAGAKKEDIEKLRSIACLLGQGFQVKDDLKDQLGQTGKPTFQDLKKGKPTSLSQLGYKGARKKLADFCLQANKKLSSLLGVERSRLSLIVDKLDDI